MPQTTRRDFLKLGGSAVSAGWLGARWPLVLAVGQVACEARDRGLGFAHLDAALAADLAAIAAQIVPSDDTGPGANEAGVIYFIDAALGNFMAGAEKMLREGAEALHAGAAAGSSRFAELDSETQRRLLTQHEQSSWFGTMRFLTVAGMFAMPKHGGNRDHLGWALLGFDHRHTWAPPFGYYDSGEHHDE